MRFKIENVYYIISTITCLLVRRLGCSLLALVALAAGAAAVGFVSTFFSGFADEGAHSLRRSPQVTLFYLKNGSFLLLPKLFSSAYGGGYIRYSRVP